VSSLQAALSLLAAGNHRGALAQAQALHAQTPDSVDVLTLLAEVHAALHEPGTAAEYLRLVTRLSPRDAAAHRRLASAEFESGQAAAAIDSYRRSIELEPNNARAHNNLGRVLEQGGDLVGATECYHSALALDDKYAIAHNNLGNVLLRDGRSSDALVCFQRAVELRPDFAEAWGNCARALLSMRRAEDALACCNRAVTARASFPEAWYLRAEALNALDRAEEALKSCDRAVALRPDYPEAVYSRANLLRLMGDSRGSVAGFCEALRLHPGLEAARMAAVVAEIPALPESAPEIDISRKSLAAALSILDTDLRLHPCTDATALVGALQPFFLAYQDEDNRELLGAHGRLCAGLMAGWQRSAGLIRSVRGGAPQSKLRVAFVSAQINTHSVYDAITRGWLRCLDRRRFLIEVFHLGSKVDPETEAARTAADYYEQGQRTVRQWTAAILDRAPDVLIYPEVGMDQTTLQLASMRLAPTQVVAWGHPVTSGLPTMDYYLSAERFEPGDGAQHYTEKLVCLPNLGTYYEPPSHIRGVARTRADNFKAGPLFICAGTPFKYSPQYDTVLVDIARRLGRCQFQFFEYRDGALSRRLLGRLNRAFAAAGLDGARHLVLRPWATASEFHGLLASSDLLLDTLGFSGFNTVIQALECGLPVVACRGRFMRGRLGSGILEQLSLTELVADDPPHYVDTVVSLAEDPRARGRIRDRLSVQLPLVYRDRSTIEALENFLLHSAGRGTRDGSTAVASA